MSSPAVSPRLPVTIINWCIVGVGRTPDKCDPCAKREDFDYFALIPDSFNAGYVFQEDIRGTLGTVPDVNPDDNKPSGAPPAFYGYYADGAQAFAIKGTGTANWTFTGADFQFTRDPDSPFPLSDPRTPGTWHVRLVYSAGPFTVIGQIFTIPGLQAGHLVMIPVDETYIRKIGGSPPIAVKPFVGGGYGVGYWYDVGHILAVPKPPSS